MPVTNVFVYTGQRSHYYGMGRDLLSGHPVFGAAMRTWSTVFANLGSPGVFESNARGVGRRRARGAGDCAWFGGTAASVAAALRLQGGPVRCVFIDISVIAESVAPGPRRVLPTTVAEVLGRAGDDIDSYRPFTEYDVASCVLVELLNTLNARLGADLKPTVLFDDPTAAELTEQVCVIRAGTDDGAPGNAATPAASGAGTRPAESVRGDADLMQLLVDGGQTLDDALAKLGGMA
jgi:hypothetical protein